MSRLVTRDLLQVGVESGIISRSRELGFGEVGKTLTIEFVFQMLKSQRVVENVS